MKILCLFLFLTVVRFSHCQDRDELIFFSLKTIQNKLTTLLDKFSEYEETQKDQQTKISEMEKKQNDIYSETQEKQKEIVEKLEDILGKLNHADNNFGDMRHEMEHIKGLTEEAGQCLRRNEFEVFRKESLEEQQEMKSFISKEIGGVITLSQTDECSTGSHSCGPHGTCVDFPLGYKCQCLPGYVWNGSSCEEIPCEGRTAKIIKDLGCVKVIIARTMANGTWEEMKAYCQEQGGRLLENVNRQSIQDMKDAFTSITKYGFDWIGVYEGKWISTGEPVDEAVWSSHWYNPTDTSKICGDFNIYDSRGEDYYGVSNDLCSKIRGAYCQFL